MSKSKYFWNFVVIIIITLLVLWFALKDNFNEIMHAITTMSYFSLAVILIWGILFTAVWGIVYWVLGKKYQPGYSLLKGIAVAFVGAFFAGITPSATGGQFGQIYILKKQGFKYSDGASILWTDFIVYQTTMMIYVTLLFIFKYNEFAGRSSWFLLCLAGFVVNVVVVIGLYTMALFPKAYIRLAQWGVRWLAKIHIVKDKDKMLAKWTGQMQNFTKEIKNFSHDKKRLFECFLINLVRLTLLYSLPYVVADCLGIDMHISQMIEVIALSSFVTMANSFIPIPGASGGTEMMFSVLFYPLFGKLTSAVMLLWRVSSYHIVILIGGITFFFASSKEDRKKVAFEEDGA